jgi:hypothetical protein
VCKIKDWLEEDKLILLEGWARDGLTNGQIANNIGIDERTLYRWKEKESLICQSLKKGREVADYEVENALFKRALGYTIQIKEQKIDKDGCVHDTTRDMHVPADTTAQIYWLKNRKPKEWRDKVEQEITSFNRYNIVNDLPKGESNE